ncbi:hypothetical protein N836_26535 [Leptolyngbya sp. Heron Island J]|uniref:hypothetical protein n=1 Tax=Leptolyngbya sp. Heron Island J TaxID=1385935 RepID=UPI0003B9C6F3|nr:hypothetical protein [Leptolyngbya sp. Heron Island J]ESA32151.1 hypothetical protein N836_26535 [Leptolyngbya sp. Heron Island J]
MVIISWSIDELCEHFGTLNFRDGQRYAIPARWAKADAYLQPLDLKKDGVDSG